MCACICVSSRVSVSVSEQHRAVSLVISQRTIGSHQWPHNGEGRGFFLSRTSSVQRTIPSIICFGFFFSRVVALSPSPWRWHCRGGPIPHSGKSLTAPPLPFLPHFQFTPPPTHKNTSPSLDERGGASLCEPLPLHTPQL